jgi:hypothetical protein
MAVLQSTPGDFRGNPTFRSLNSPISLPRAHHRLLLHFERCDGHGVSRSAMYSVYVDHCHSVAIFPANPAGCVMIPKSCFHALSRLLLLISAGSARWFGKRFPQSAPDALACASRFDSQFSLLFSSAAFFAAFSLFSSTDCSPSTTTTASRCEPPRHTCHSCSPSTAWFVLSLYLPSLIPGQGRPCHRSPINPPCEQ